MSYRDTASFGKRQEYIVIAELLKRGFDVYMTLVDDQGIDCVVRLDSEHYIDIQIKARSKDAKNWCGFAAMSFEPRANLYFIFYTEKNDTMWIVPSAELSLLCRSNASGKNVGKRSIAFPKRNDGTKAEQYEKYRNDNGFELLKQFGAYPQSERGEPRVDRFVATDADVVFGGASDQ